MASFTRVWVIHPCGLTPLILQFSMSVAITAQLSPPSSEPAQGIFAIQCEGADRAFDGIGVELDAAVVDEPGQSIPAGERIADRLAELALGADLAARGGKILMKITDDDAAAFGPSGTALLGG